MPRVLMRNAPRSHGLLLLTLGAAAGVLVGAVLADRLGGFDRMLAGRRPSEDDGEGGMSDPDDRDDSDYDDHDELSPESIAHVHMGARRGESRRRPDGATPDVLTLETRVLEAFHNDPVLRERAIDIGAIAEGVIELTGWVHAPSEVQHAVTIARGVPDVFHVVDQLAVRRPARTRRATDPRPVAPLDSMTAAPPPRAD